MRLFFTAIALLYFISSCKETGVSIAKPSTFIHYFNDGQQDLAVDLLETSDHSILILSYSKPSNGKGWIHIIKTDLYGNQSGVGEILIKSSGNGDLVPSNFVAAKNGAGEDILTIVGSNISATSSRLFIARINESTFTFQDSSSYNYFSSSKGYLKGIGVTVNADSIYVLGQVVQPDLLTPAVPNDMFFAQFLFSTSGVDTVFQKTYGAGTSSLGNRLYLDYYQNHAYWGGTRSDGNGVRVRLVECGFNSLITTFDLTYPPGDNGGVFQGSDLCQYGQEFGIIGSGGSPYDSIIFVKVGSDGNMLTPSVVGYGPLNKDFSQSTQPANSICSTSDGGFLLLGTIAKDAQGTDTDYLLIKTDGNGKRQWSKTQGGKYLDTGVRVLQASDGGYIVLGTTTLANVNTVLLMKTDLEGNIQ